MAAVIFGCLNYVPLADSHEPEAEVVNVGANTAIGLATLACGASLVGSIAAICYLVVLAFSEGFSFYLPDLPSQVSLRLEGNAG